MRKTVPAFAATAAAALIVAAGCGGSGDDTATTSGGGGGGGMDHGVTIISPKNGASVNEPFTIKFDAGDIGPTDSGKDHVHIYADGKESEYTVVTKNHFVIKGLSKGQHTIEVAKQHADHSPTGEEAKIKVTVSGGATGKSGKSKKDNGGGDSGGGGYSY